MFRKKQEVRIFKNRNVGIVGLGLIGGSIARRLVAADKTLNIIGVDKDEETLKYAFSNDVIHLGLTDFRILKGCEIIFVATPIDITSKIINDIYSVVGDAAIITDVAGVKGEIVKNLPKGIRYVGGHPMAGSENCGIKQSYAHMFENAYYVLTSESDDKDIETVSGLVKKLGAIPIVMTVNQHDEAVARVSHLPHAVAFALVNYAIKTDNDRVLAATGFRDMTRIASSGGGLWTAAFLNNDKEIVDAIEGITEKLNILKSSIQEKNVSAIENFIREANEKRQEINIFKCERSTINVDIFDKPGSIASVAAILGKAKVNIKNIRIVNSREREGALHIEFASCEDAEKAKRMLEKKYRLF